MWELGPKAIENSYLRTKHDVGQVRSKYELREKEKHSQESSFLSYQKEERSEKDLWKNVEKEPESNCNKS